MGQSGDEEIRTVAEYEKALDDIVAEFESYMTTWVGDREGVVFLTPMGANGRIAVGAWQAVAQWELQEDQQELLHAAWYGIPDYDPEYTQTFSNLKSRMLAATASSDLVQDRVEAVQDLEDYYRDIGLTATSRPTMGQGTGSHRHTPRRRRTALETNSKAEARPSRG